MLRLRQQARRRIMRELDRNSNTAVLESSVHSLDPRHGGSSSEATQYGATSTSLMVTRLFLITKGSRVEDVDLAHRLAVEVAVEMIRTGEADIAGWRGWRVEATDAS